MPRSLAPQLINLGFNVQDVRDIGLRGQPDTEVMAIAVERDTIIITKDRGFTNSKSWDENFLQDAVEDRTVIQFAIGFYDGLGGRGTDGNGYEMAYKLGCNAIHLENLLAI